MADERLYSSPLQASQDKENYDSSYDSREYRHIALPHSEFVSGRSSDVATYKSDSAMDNAVSFAITPGWLKKCILDEDVKARTAPFLLCFAGLPNSGKSTALNQLMDHSFGYNIYNNNVDRGIRYYDFAAVRRPPQNNIKYEDAKCLVNNGYILVVESAIEYLLRIRGHSIKDVAVLPSKQSYFQDEDLNKHLISVFKNLRNLTCKSDAKETLSIWSQSLASGISMINIWDIGLNKAVLYILPRLAGLLYNCRSLLFFNLIRDLDHLYDLPEIPENHHPSRNDKECIMRWRARIHYLLRFAKLSHDNPNGSKVCKLIATCKSEIEKETLEKKIKEFKNEADMVSTQMKVKDLVDTDGVLDFHPNNENSFFLKVLLDDIVHSQFQKPIEMPLSFVFLRSFFYTSSDISIKKDALKQKAAVLGVEGNKLEQFCQLFTSFGSIIDVSLIDSSSDLVILKPVDFLHELDKLFYPSPNVDPLVSTYGIVKESTAELIFGSKEASSVFMSFLMSIGLAVKLSSEQLSITLSDQFAYYIPNVCTAKPILECEPTALHLLHDINEPLSHFKVKFAECILKEYHFTRLEMSKEPHINVTRFRAFPSSIPSDGVVFDLVYLGDAIEFRILTPYDHSCIEEICTQIIRVCHKIMPQKVKYNFAVMCSEDPNPKAIYKLRRNRHLLPSEDLCTKCIDKGRLESDIFKAWNAVLIKDANKVPPKKILNGDPLTLDEAVDLAKKMSALSQHTLSCITGHLSDDLFLTLPIEEKSCLKMIFAWEDSAKENGEEFSKRELAIKLMNVANEIHENNQEESEKLESIARSLNFRVARTMSISEKKN